MISIYDFLVSKGIKPLDGFQCHDGDLKIHIGEVKELIAEYANLLREEQIKYCAIGSAHYTSKQVRNSGARLDDDMKEHLQVVRVPIIIQHTETY